MPVVENGFRLCICSRLFRTFSHWRVSCLEFSLDCCLLQKSNIQNESQSEVSVSVVS